MAAAKSSEEWIVQADGATIARADGGVTFDRDRFALVRNSAARFVSTET